MKTVLRSLIALAFVTSGAVEAQQPRFVRLGDVNTAQVQVEPTSGGAALLETGELVFSGSDSEGGEEIWVQYSNSSSARRRVDFRPGGASSSPRDFAPLTGDRFTVVVDDGITGPEVVVLNSYGDFFPNDSGQDLCPGRDHAAPRFLGRRSGKALYVLDDGADPYGQPGESVWQFSAGAVPRWLGTFKVGSVRQPRNGTADELYFVGQRLYEAELALFRVNSSSGSQAALLCVLGDAAVAEPLPDQVDAVTPGMVCYRGFSGSQPMLRAFRANNPGNVISQSLGPVTDPSIVSNGSDRICYAGYESATGIEPWMIVDDMMGSPLTPQLVVDGNASTSTTISASRFILQGGILYFETGGNSRVLKFVDTSLANRVAHSIFSDSEFISQRVPVSTNKLAYVQITGGVNSLVLYHTSTMTKQSLAQAVKVRDLWARQGSLSAIIEANGTDRLYKLVGTSWIQVRNFVTDSASPMRVTGDESSLNAWVIGTEMGLSPLLYRYPVASSGSASSVSMIYDGPSNNRSSHPADFHDIGGHLFLTALKDDLRVLFHSPDGTHGSLQPVQLATGGGDFAVGELVRLGSQLFLRSAANGRLCRALVEPAPVGAVVRPVLDGASPVPAERLIVAAGKVFFVQVDATTETLRYVNPDLTLGTVQVFQKPTGGQAITQMTGTPDRLFFTASVNPYNSTDPIALWSTTGSGMPEQKIPPFHPEKLNILGVWDGKCVSWQLHGGGSDNWELFSWSGLSGEGFQAHWGGGIERRPESSHAPGFPSGVEFGGRFAFCDREGSLNVLGPSGGMEYDWRNWGFFVRPECMAVLNGKLVWKAYGQRSWYSAIWQSPWLQWSAASGLDTIDYTQGPASPLRAVAGRVWSVAGFPNRTVLKSWNGLPGGLQEHAEPVDPYQALGDVAMGTFRGRLVLSARPSSLGNSGSEPTLLLENTAPAAPAPLKLTGTRTGHPFTFTYADLLTLGINDAESDPFSFAVGMQGEGMLTVNGSGVSDGHLLSPGDIFEWTPASGIGDVTAFNIRAADTWDSRDIPLIIRVETPHDVWTRQHFTPAQLADPLLSGPAADADADGVSNALEFLFGRLPHEREGESGWSLSSTTPAAGQRRAVFTFNRLAVLPLGTTVLVEQSEDLQNWTSVAEKLQNAAWTFPVPGVSVEEVTLPDGRIETRVSVEESSSLNRFLRLRLVLP